MKRGVLLLGLLAILGTSVVASEEAPPPEPIGVAERQEGDVSIFEAILPGDIVDWGVIPSEGASGALAFLVEMENDARQVFGWSLDGGRGLEEIGPPLPEEIDILLTTGGGDGEKGEVLVADGGVVLGLSANQEWVKRFESRYEVFPVRNVRRGRPVPDSGLILRSVGLLQGLDRHPATGDLRSKWEFDLPLRVDREWGGLRLDSPPVMLLEHGTAGSPRLILGPEAYGKRRLRSLLLTPTEEEGMETLEAWNMLPTPEDVEESWYVNYDGEPALIVTSVMSEEHGVFEKKKLRLFQLAVDRTRSGSGPLLSVMTRSRNWYSTCAGIADVNGDGLDDLVSAQPKGLGAGSLWVEAHLSRSAGGFEPKARGSEIEVEEGELCTLSNDVDGDKRVDLVVVEDDSLLVFTLIQAAKSKVVVSDQPRWRLAFHDVDSRPHPVELVGQGSSQILLTGHTEGKRQAAYVLFFR